MTTYDIHLEQLVDTTPEIAFDHWADASARQQWGAPEDGWIIEAETDLRVGGTFRLDFGPTPDQMHRTSGVFTEVDRPHRLVCTNLFVFPDGRSYETVVTVSFEPRDGKTLMTLSETGYTDKDIRDEHAGGWPSFFDQFERSIPS